jgi:HK97 family phage prohead protease
MKMKHLTRPLEVKSVKDDGTFEGYGSVFNVIDSYHEIVLPGAFQESIAQHKTSGTSPALLWQHDSSSPIGVWASMEEDDHGLKMTGQLALGTQQGREAYELLKMGAVRGLSIGFSVAKDGESYDEHHGVWNLSKINLWETSIVTFPANQSAQVTAVRAALDDGVMPTVRDFEQFLMRDAGFSRSQARTVINDGFKNLLTHDAECEVLAATQNLLTNFKGTQP